MVLDLKEVVHRLAVAHRLAVVVVLMVVAAVVAAAAAVALRHPILPATGAPTLRPTSWSARPPLQ